MGRSRNLADLLDANGDVKSGSLDNVPPSNDASALTTGTLSADRLAAGSIGAAKLAETYLTPTGDGSNLTGIASDKLTSEFNLDTGVTLGAGKLVSVKSDGTLAAYPELTDVTGGQDSGTLYGSGTDFATDVSSTTGISWKVVSGQPTSTLYAKGHVVSSSSSWTTGTEFTKSWSLGGAPDNDKTDSINLYPHPTRNNAFIVAWARANASGYGTGIGFQFFILDVNSTTGAITEVSGGISTSYTMSGLNCGSCIGANSLVIFDSDGSNIWLYAYGRHRTGSGYLYQYYTATLSGTTFSSFVSEGSDYDTSALTYSTHFGSVPGNEIGAHGGSHIGKSSVNVSSGGYATWLINATNARSVTWSGSAGGLAPVSGSSNYTDQNLVTLFNDAGFNNSWEIFTFIDGDTFVGVYNSTLGKLSILTASIDSTGSMTYVDSAVLFNTGEGSYCDINAKSDTEILVTFRYSGITYLIPVGLNADRTINDRASVVIVGTDPVSSDHVIKQTSTSDNYYAIVRNSGLDGVKLYEADVPYYNETKPFQYIGVSETSQSSSPASVVTHGVAGGFTGLTIGAVYYASDDLDGTVTTATTSGIRIGRAVSATEILVGEFS